MHNIWRKAMNKWLEKDMKLVATMNNMF
jgi:hypothetical protein